MKTYGTPTLGLTEKVGEDYEAPHGERLKLTLKQDCQSLYTKEALENMVIEEAKKQFGEDAKLLYWKINVEQYAYYQAVYFFHLDCEVHVESQSPLTVNTAIAISLLILGVVVSLWLGTLAWGTYRFVASVPPEVGGLTSIIVIVIIILFALLLFFGGGIGVSKGGVRVGK